MNNNKNRSRGEAIEEIECYILKNKLQAHTKLPSERTMSEMWGFNRITLRAAIQRLILEGKLYNKRGSGTYIADEKIERNLQDLESPTKFISNLGKSIQNKVISAKIIESNKQTTQKLHLPLGHKVALLERVRFVENEPFMLETSFLNYNLFTNIEKYDFELESLYEVIEKQYGYKISKGEENISIAYATSYEAELLHINEGDEVFYVSGAVYNEKEVPMEYFKSICRADKMRFVSILKREKVE